MLECIHFLSWHAYFLIDSFIKSYINSLDTLYTEVKDKSAEYQSLLRQGGHPQQAIQLTRQQHIVITSQGNGAIYDFGNRVRILKKMPFCKLGGTWRKKDRKQICKKIFFEFLWKMLSWQPRFESHWYYSFLNINFYIILTYYF